MYKSDKVTGTIYTKEECTRRIGKGDIYNMLCVDSFKVYVW